MDQRESIESTIIKSERVNKPHDSKPAMDMQWDAIVDNLTECSQISYAVVHELFGLEESLKVIQQQMIDNPSVYGKLAILRDRAEEWSAEELSAAFNKLTSDLYDIVERWGQCLVPLSQPSNDISLRTSDVIKKELKHAKNPMEIKRLNKELTTYYKEHKKRKGGSK